RLRVRVRNGLDDRLDDCFGSRRLVAAGQQRHLPRLVVDRQPVAGEEREADQPVDRAEGAGDQLDGRVVDDGRVDVLDPCRPELERLDLHRAERVEQGEPRSGRDLIDYAAVAGGPTVDDVGGRAGG